jgi:hypothetical protein
MRRNGEIGTHSFDILARPVFAIQLYAPWLKRAAGIDRPECLGRVDHWRRACHRSPVASRRPGSRAAARGRFASTPAANSDVGNRIAKATPSLRNARIDDTPGSFLFLSIA